MAKTYSEELKSKVIAKMLPPQNLSVAEVAADTGIPKDTLYTWRSKNCGGQVAKGTASTSFSGAQKFQLLLESATLNEHDSAEFCRRHGFFPEQLKAWRKACEMANDVRPRREEQMERRELREQNKQLQRELWRKEKALAEMAALMVLKKKVQSIWGELEDENSILGSDAK
jgi:transposase